MGIKNLKVILNQKCKCAINTRKLDNYRGMIFGIDISIFLYKYLYNNDDHLEGLTRLTMRLLKNHITPVFIFDGKPPKEKDETLQNRREKRDFMTIKKKIIENCINLDRNSYEEFKCSLLDYIDTNNSSYVIDENEIQGLFEKNNDDLQKESDKLTKKIIYVTPYHIESSKKLFDLFGVKYIHAPCEAESLLAILGKNGVVDGCVSEDTDILANGGHLFLRNFNADKNIVDEYCLHGILNSLELTYEQFIDLCILCGCDYTTKINGLGPITAHKLVSKYSTIENIIENNQKFTIPDNFDYVKARELFKNPVNTELLGNINTDTHMQKPEIKLLTNFLINTKLKEKHFKDIERNLMNYYLNIEGIYQYDLKTKKQHNAGKITDYFSNIVV
jgi:flap endonuclease-1